MGESTMLEVVIQQALAVPVKDVVVVLGANREKILPEIKSYPVTVVENREWKNGLGSSISAGVKYISSTLKTCKALVILLGDQPLIDNYYVKELIELWRKDPSQPVATRYPGKNGVPAIFPQKLFNKLSVLTGDSGAKAILNKNTSIYTLEPGDRNKDVDTPEDYKEITGRFT